MVRPTASRGYRRSSCYLYTAPQVRELQTIDFSHTLHGPSRRFMSLHVVVRPPQLLQLCTSDMEAALTNAVQRMQCRRGKGTVSSSWPPWCRIRFYPFMICLAPNVPSKELKCSSGMNQCSQAHCSTAVHGRLLILSAHYRPSRVYYCPCCLSQAPLFIDEVDGIPCTGRAPSLNCMGEVSSIFSLISRGRCNFWNFAVAQSCDVFVADPGGEELDA